MPSEPGRELREVLSHYDLGRLVHYERDTRGTVNTSYFVDLEQGGVRRKYFLRRYVEGTRPEELAFENSLIRHLARLGDCPVAQVHSTREGPNYLLLPASGDRTEADYYAIFDFLPGDDRYTWVSPRCAPGELHHAGALLADFHRSASSLQAEGQRVEPKILELLDVIESAWAGSRAKSQGSVFDTFLAEHFDRVCENIAATRAVLQTAEVRQLPEVIIHCDYHPGNLKFEGEAITGLFDFCWSKVDLRAFDVGLALWYFCVSWEPAVDGELRLDDVQTFLSAYQRRLESRSGFPPLSTAELRCLPDLISAGNIYVLYWTIRDFFGKPGDPDEYLVYLKHHIASARWLEDRTNREALEGLLGGLLRADQR